MTAALETTGLGKRYRRTWALQDCNLTVPRGRIAALVGPNGAGKTTLLHLAVGRSRPRPGRSGCSAGRPARPTCFPRSGSSTRTPPRSATSPRPSTGSAAVSPDGRPSRRVVSARRRPPSPAAPGRRVRRRAGREPGRPGSLPNASFSARRRPRGSPAPGRAARRPARRGPRRPSARPAAGTRRRPRRAGSPTRSGTPARSRR